VTAPASTSLPAYGMPVNPFAMSTLDPLVSLADRQRVSLVDGWKDLTLAIDLINKRVALDKAVFFVVAGASSTGRSSVANYLVHRWAQARGITGDAVVVHRRDPGSNGGVYTAEIQIMEWAQGILLRPDMEELNFTAVTQQWLEQLTDSTSIFKFGQSLRGIDRDLRTPQPGMTPRYLAAIMERGKGDDLIRKISECFLPTRAIVIITVDKSYDTATLLGQVGQFLTPDVGLRIDIGPIYGDDVVTLIQDQWTAVCQNVENPFDLTAAADVFASPRPISRIVNLLERMLRVRQVLHDGQDPWPIARSLAFSKEQMQGLLQEFDRELPAGQEE
jgi:hypothetical protein